MHGHGARHHAPISDQARQGRRRFGRRGQRRPRRGLDGHDRRVQLQGAVEVERGHRLGRHQPAGHLDHRLGDDLLPHQRHDLHRARGGGQRHRRRRLVGHGRGHALRGVFRSGHQDRRGRAFHPAGQRRRLLLGGNLVLEGHPDGGRRLRDECRSPQDGGGEEFGRELHDRGLQRLELRHQTHLI